VYSVEERWELDTIFYTSLTLFSKLSFSTLYHSYWWKDTGYRTDYDFEKRSINYEGDVNDSSFETNCAEGQASVKGYEYNHYSDLLIFPILPYRLHRTFLIKFNDPGYGKSQVLEYTVAGTENIKTCSGKLLRCWIIEHKPISGFNDYQKFWISADTGEVLRQLDYLGSMYRYRVKLMIHPW